MKPPKVEGRLGAVEVGILPKGSRFETKFIDRHLPGTEASKRLIAREGAAHVFLDRATLNRVERAIIERGIFTGTVRGSARFGLRFEKPIGYRVDASGKKIPLHYGEIKLNPQTGGYHLIPRTGPSTR